MDGSARHGGGGQQPLELKQREARRPLRGAEAFQEHHRARGLGVEARGRAIPATPSTSSGMSPTSSRRKWMVSTPPTTSRRSSTTSNESTVLATASRMDNCTTTTAASDSRLRCSLLSPCHQGLAVTATETSSKGDRTSDQVNDLRRGAGCPPPGVVSQLAGRADLFLPA